MQGNLIDTRKKLLRIGEAFLVLCGLTLLIFLWYRNNDWTVLVGDDLHLINMFEQHGLWNTMFSEEFIQLGKVRPVSMLLTFFSYSLCGLNFEKYYILNRIALSLSAFTIYSICKKIDISKWLACVTATLIVICPFNEYGVWQVYGICEIASLLLCVISIRLLLCYFYSDKQTISFRFTLANAFVFFVIVMNAERFMYLFAIYFIAVIIKKQKMFHKLAHIGIYVSAIALRIILLVMSGSPILGTGRGEVGSLLDTFIPNALRAFVNMFGFALGDEWHGRFSLFQIPSWILLLSAIKMLLVFCLGIHTVYMCLKHRDRYELGNLIILGFCILSLFCYALVGTTHGEDRFIWIPYASCVMFICRCISPYFHNAAKLFDKKRIVSIIALLLFSASDAYYLANKVHAHFRYSQVMAETSCENIRKLDNYQSADNVFLIGNSDYHYVYDEGNFFKYYLFDEPVYVQYFENYTDLSNAVEQKKVLGEKTIILQPDNSYPIPYGVEANWAD